MKIYTLLLPGIVLGQVLLRDVSWQGSTQLHTLMEVVATFLALFVGAMALVRYYTKKTNLFLFIGVGFFGTGLLDGYHTVVTSSFFAQVFPSPPPSLIPWSWIASRVFLSLMLWLSYLAWRYESKWGVQGRVGDGAIYFGAGVLTMGSFLFFALVPMPQAYYPHLFFHRPEEFVPALFFGLALLGFLRKGTWRNDGFEHWLILALIVSVAGQVAFMSFSSQLFDRDFDAAHLLKKVSYVCVLIGLLVSMYHLFVQAETNAQEIRESNAVLAKEVEERRALEEQLRQHRDQLEKMVAARTTELATANEQLGKRNVQLHQRNKELDDFDYVASHDLKAPLRGIDNLSQWIAEDAEEVLPEDSLKHLRLMQKRVRRMEELLDGLLHYSRAGRYDYDSETVGAEALIKEVIDTLEAPRKFTFSISTLPVLDTVKIPLQQVFQNLIGNAIKYHDRSDGVVKIGAVENGLFYKFWVEDDGPGIAPEYHDKAFQMFQKLQSRDDVEGTGIGLSVVKKTVESYGGNVELISKAGQGARFEFTWPKQVEFL